MKRYIFPVGVGVILLLAIFYVLDDRDIPIVSTVRFEGGVHPYKDCLTIGGERTCVVRANVSVIYPSRDPDYLIETSVYGRRESIPDGVDIRGRKRVVFLGDSFVFGFGIANEFTFPSLLQEKLEAVCPGRYWVENWGLDGAGLRDYAIQAERGGGKDVSAVFVFVLNGDELSEYDYRDVFNAFAADRGYNETNRGSILSGGSGDVGKEWLKYVLEYTEGISYDRELDPLVARIIDVYDSDTPITFFSVFPVDFQDKLIAQLQEYEQASYYSGVVLPRDREYFIRLDGHLNELGHTVVADGLFDDVLGPLVSKECGE